jgi:dUTP pyrophosphatase
MIRGFKAVSRFLDNEGNPTIKLPERSTQFSAGYDFFAPEDIEISPSFFRFVDMPDSRGNVYLQKLEFPDVKPVTTLIPTGVKAYMADNEYLAMFNRSSNPKKLGLILANSVGIVDKDYYDNPDNEGEIGFAYYNIFPYPVTIKKGDKLGQGVFQTYLICDSDTATGTRTGGWGSTNAK